MANGQYRYTFIVLWIKVEKNISNGILWGHKWAYI